jgi:hypothetical protein
LMSGVLFHVVVQNEWEEYDDVKAKTFPGRKGSECGAIPNGTVVPVLEEWDLSEARYLVKHHEINNAHRDDVEEGWILQMHTRPTGVWSEAGSVGGVEAESNQASGKRAPMRSTARRSKAARLADPAAPTASEQPGSSDRPGSSDSVATGAPRTALFGHPECTQAEDCLGNPNSDLYSHLSGKSTKHHANRGSLYCRECAKALGKKWPELQFLVVCLPDSPSD